MNVPVTRADRRSNTPARLDSDGRSFPHLCPEADLRDAMSDAEFWDHVLHAGAPDWDRYEVDGPGADDGLVDTPCPECHATGACGFDTEGRPMIHAIKATEDR